MIVDGLVYECLDKRESGLLSGFVRLYPVPDGFQVGAESGRWEFIPIDEDRQVEESPETVTFHTPEGDLFFVSLTLDDYNRLHGDREQKFQTTKQLQDFYSLLIDNR